MTANPELLPCPFCGKDDLALHSFSGVCGRRYWCIICRDCSSGGPAELGQMGAIEKWNIALRPTPPAERKPK